MRALLAVATVVAMLLPGGQHVSAAAAQERGSVDPIRCWWQSSTGAITLGETFNVVLTCAVIETPSMQVVADESRLGVASIQMAPFEILGGSHPADAHRLQRRLFQYHYQLRLISADAIGRDVNVPALSIPYRVHSRVGAAAALEGRDLTYLMPALPIKVLSLVPKEAIDIRDGSSASLAAVEALRFRGSMFEILAVALGMIGVVMAVLALVPLARGTRATGAAISNRLPDRAVAARAAQEWADLQSAAAGEGWTDAAVARALAAVRVIAALAIHHPISEKAWTAGAPAPEGRLDVTHGRIKGRRAAVSAAVTATDVALAGSQLHDEVSLTHRHQLEGLQSALAELTAALYRQSPVRDAAVLNEGVRHAVEVGRQLQSERSAWSLLRQGFPLRRGYGGQVGAQGTWWSQR